MVAYFMSLVYYAPYHLFVALYILPNNKKSRFCVVFCQHIEDLRRLKRVGSVVKSQGDHIGRRAAARKHHAVFVVIVKLSGPAVGRYLVNG